MRYHRITDQLVVDEREISKLLADGNRVVVQFSKPIYTTEMLNELNRLSTIFGSQFELRFYAHHPHGFDASILAKIPDVVSLSLDCLTSAKNLNALSSLRRIEEFSLGVYDLDDAAILSNPALRGLRKLSLGDSKRLNVDLAILGAFNKLELLHVTGNSKGIGSLVHIDSLKNLSLGQMKKVVSFGFVSKIKNLESLQILLGGRDSIVEIDNPRIQELKIIRVRGLAELGSLSRFKQLREFQLEDQIRIDSVQFNNQLLNIAKFINCKTLSRIEGIELLPSLRHLRVGRTALDYETFKSTAFPKALKILAFYTGKRGVDAAIRKDLDARGFNEYESTELIS